jgi:hypothetical protein
MVGRRNANEVYENDRLNVVGFSLPVLSSTAALITPVIDGAIESPRDGTPDYIWENWVVETLLASSSSRSFERRGIIEFDISGLPHNSEHLILSLPVFRSFGPYPFKVDAYTYAGDGVLALTDFSAGIYFKSFDYSGEPMVAIDVTLQVSELQASGSKFAGFNFRLADPSSIPPNGPYLAFNSLEFGPAATLSTNTVPEPGSIGAIAATIALTAFPTRCRRSLPHKRV